MPVSIGSHPRYLEELRIGGGYGSAPDGGADFDGAGNIAASGTLAVDGDASFGGAVSVGGDLSVSGMDTNWRVYLPASAGIPDPALPCGAVTPVSWRNFHVGTPTMAFDPGTPEAAYFQFRLPPGYDGRPLIFTIEWSATAGTSGDVRWGVLPISFDNAETLVVVGTTTYVEDAFVATSAIHMCSISATPYLSSAASFNTVRIIRLSNDSLDTFDADAMLIGLEVSV
jgi:hypothetical protein